MLRAPWRTLARRGLIIVIGVCAVSALIEHILEVRDAARLTANETFYSARGRRIRYHLTGADDPRPTVVLISGAMASLEQWNGVQTALSSFAPTISYDRDGTGFSDPAEAHEANAEVDELDQLLHSKEIAGPFVLVSYSSSAMMATVFAARHRDIVKGIVFVDPLTRSLAPGAKTHRRILLRATLSNPIEAFFGFTRLKRVIMGLDRPASSLQAERSNAILESTHHWLASSYNALHMDEAADQADAALATHPFADLPLAVLTAADPAESEYFHGVFDRQMSLVGSSERGIVRAVHGKHSEILNDPVAVGVVVDLIRTITDEVRANANRYRPS